jgi:succinoglycan biosynthesis transport protein ExoP
MANVPENPMEMVREYWAMIRRHRWWIFLGTVACTLAAFTVIAYLPNYYTATTTILVDPQRIPERYVSPVVSGDPSARLNTLSQEVLSTSRLQEVIDQLDLYEEMRGKATHEDIISRMRKDITIEVKQGPGLGAFTISYQGRNRDLVAKVVNLMAGNFIKWNLQSRETQTEGTTEFIGDQLQQAKRSLEEQEKKLSEFKLRHVGEMPEQQQANLQVLSQLQASYQANSDALNRLDLQRMVILRGESNGAGAVPQTERGRLEAERRQLEDKVAELQRRYTLDFPDVVEATQRLERVKAQIKALPAPDASSTQKNGSGGDMQVVMIDRERKRLEEAQKRVQAQIQAYQARVEAAPIREQQMAEVTRNYQASKGLYQSLLDKNFSAEMAKDLERKQQAERFIILDPARVPERPYKPKRTLLMFASFVGSLLGCVALVVAKDMFDPRVKSETELKKMLPAAVSLLGAIPEIETAAEHRMRMVFAAFAIGIALMGCLLEAGLYWKVHPFL